MSSTRRNPPAPAKPRFPIVWLVLAVVAIDIFILFFSDPWVPYGFGFYWPHFLSRMAVPAIIGALVLKVPFSALGIAAPRLSSARWTKVVVLLGASLLLIVAVQLSPEFLVYYSELSGWEGAARKITNFTLFVLSTIPGWEWMHRGFLLFGLLRFLQERHGVGAARARKIAVAVVCAFETLFHLAKPPTEILGMMLGSPVLSIIALRTNSIVIPLAIHLVVEGSFLFAMLSA